MENKSCQKYIIEVTAYRSSSRAWIKAALFFCLNKHLKVCKNSEILFIKTQMNTHWFFFYLLLSISILQMRLLISSSARRTFSNISILSASWTFCCWLTPYSRRSCSYILPKLKSNLKNNWMYIWIWRWHRLSDWPKYPFSFLKSLHLCGRNKLCVHWL